MSPPVGPKGDLRQMMAENPIPAIAPVLVPEAPSAKEATGIAVAVLDKLRDGLSAGDVAAVQDLFFPQQAYWKDSLALTYHLRTFPTPSGIAPSLIETAASRKLGDLGHTGEANFNPVFKFIDCSLEYTTKSPAAKGTGKILLLPLKGGETIQWKIWVLSTRLESLDVHPEDEKLLRQPGRSLDGDLETDVFIVGGGNAAATLAARLKALGVESIMAERNANVGDNWMLRYDSLAFHVPTSFCDMPYLPYTEEDRGRLLSRDMLANQLRRYVNEFHLNTLLSTTTKSATYDNGQWTVQVVTPSGEHTIKAKHLVQATGVSSQKPYVPEVANEGYKGLNMHSSQYKNAALLKDKGVSSVIVVGSANTAFDLVQDFHDAGIKVTMHVRSPTYIIPVGYVTHPLGLGVYDSGVEAADKLVLSLPAPIDGALSKGLFAALASAEPERYKALAAAGFPVFDSADKDAALMHNLIERAGGHYVDVGVTGLIADGKVGVKSGVEISSLSEGGLRFEDGSTLDADAVIWCTGFCDTDTRGVASEVIGTQLADRLEPTWGLDTEGEVRGMWKRSGVDRFWVMGGYTQQHRWHSRTLALQIKADLEGVLPEPYLQK